MLLFNTISLYGCIYTLAYILLIFIKRPFNFNFSLSYRLFIATYIAIFAIIMARLFYVIFYEPQYYFNNLDNALEIIMLYKGGMSFHGAFIGVILALLCLDRRNFWINADSCTLVAIICLPLGRIANFLNGEIYGTITNPTIGFIFLGIDANYRHAITLYEAFCIGPLFAFILYFLYKKHKITKVGDIALSFAFYYCICRFFLEFLREPDKSIGYVYSFLSMGQILSICCLLISYVFYLKRANTIKLSSIYFT